ncbi:MAG: sodium/proton-translocating pyrophosphatase [Alphaproteobacteria bacterium]
MCERAEAARQGLAQGLKISFRAGAVTGMLVAGLALWVLRVITLCFCILVQKGAKWWMRSSLRFRGIADFIFARLWRWYFY